MFELLRKTFCAAAKISRTVKDRVLSKFFDVLISIFFVIVAIFVIDAVSPPVPPHVSYSGYYCEPNLAPDVPCKKSDQTITKHNRANAGYGRSLSIEELKYLRPENPGTLTRSEIVTYDPKTSFIVSCVTSYFGGGYTEKEGQFQSGSKIKCPSDDQIASKGVEATLHTLHVSLQNESEFQVRLYCKYRNERLGKPSHVEQGPPDTCRTSKDDVIESFKVEILPFPLYQRLLSATCGVVNINC